MGWQISKLVFYAQSTIMVISAWCRVGGGRWGGGGRYVSWCFTPIRPVRLYQDVGGGVGGGGGRAREEDRVIKTHINCFRTGYSGGNAGGSHSGEGGTTTDPTSVGAVYGDFRNPATVGSGGRLTRPGGALDIEATKVIINGQLLAK